MKETISFVILLTKVCFVIAETDKISTNSTAEGLKDLNNTTEFETIYNTSSILAIQDETLKNESDENTFSISNKSENVSAYRDGEREIIPLAQEIAKKNLYTIIKIRLLGNLLQRLPVEKRQILFMNAMKQVSKDTKDTQNKHTRAKAFSIHHRSMDNSEESSPESQEISEVKADNNGEDMDMSSKENTVHYNKQTEQELNILKNQVSDDVKQLMKTVFPGVDSNAPGNAVYKKKGHMMQIQGIPKNQQLQKQNFDFFSITDNLSHGPTISGFASTEHYMKDAKSAEQENFIAKKTRPQPVFLRYNNFLPRLPNLENNPDPKDKISDDHFKESKQMYTTQSSTTPSTIIQQPYLHVEPLQETLNLNPVIYNALSEESQSSEIVFSKSEKNKKERDDIQNHHTENYESSIYTIEEERDNVPSHNRDYPKENDASKSSEEDLSYDYKFDTRSDLSQFNSYPSADVQDYHENNLLNSDHSNAEEAVKIIYDLFNDYDDHFRDYENEQLNFEVELYPTSTLTPLGTTQKNTGIIVDKFRKDSSKQYYVDISSEISSGNSNSNNKNSESQSRETKYDPAESYISYNRGGKLTYQHDVNGKNYFTIDSRNPTANSDNDSISTDESEEYHKSFNNKHSKSSEDVSSPENVDSYTGVENIYFNEDSGSSEEFGGNDQINDSTLTTKEEKMKDKSNSSEENVTFWENTNTKDSNSKVESYQNDKSGETFQNNDNIFSGSRETEEGNNKSTAGKSEESKDSSEEIITNKKYSGSHPKDSSDVQHYKDSMTYERSSESTENKFIKEFTNVNSEMSSKDKSASKENDRSSSSNENKNFDSLEDSSISCEGEYCYSYSSTDSTEKENDYSEKETVDQDDSKSIEETSEQKKLKQLTNNKSSHSEEYTSSVKESESKELSNFKSSEEQIYKKNEGEKAESREQFSESRSLPSTSDTIYSGSSESSEKRNGLEKDVQYSDSDEYFLNHDRMSGQNSDEISDDDDEQLSKENDMSKSDENKGQSNENKVYSSNISFGSGSSEENHHEKEVNSDSSETELSSEESQEQIRKVNLEKEEVGSDGKNEEQSKQNSEYKNSIEKPDNYYEDSSEETVYSVGSSEEPVYNQDITEEPENHEDITEEPENYEESTEKLENNEDSSEEPDNNEDSIEEPENNEDSIEEPQNNEDSIEEPYNNADSTEKPESNEESTEEPDYKEDSTEEPDNKMNSTEEPNDNEGSIEKSDNNADSIEEPKDEYSMKPLSNETTEEEPMEENNIEEKKRESSSDEKPTEKIMILEKESKSQENSEEESKEENKDVTDNIVDQNSKELSSEMKMKDSGEDNKHDEDTQVKENKMDHKNEAKDPKDKGSNDNDNPDCKDKKNEDYFNNDKSGEIRNDDDLENAVEMISEMFLFDIDKSKSNEHNDYNSKRKHSTLMKYDKDGRVSYLLKTLFNLRKQWLKRRYGSKDTKYSSKYERHNKDSSDLRMTLPTLKNNLYEKPRKIGSVYGHKLYGPHGSRLFLHRPSHLSSSSYNKIRRSHFNNLHPKPRYESSLSRYLQGRKRHLYDSHSSNLRPNYVRSGYGSRRMQIRFENNRNYFGKIKNDESQTRKDLLGLSNFLTKRSRNGIDGSITVNQGREYNRNNNNDYDPYHNDVIHYMDNFDDDTVVVHPLVTSSSY
ncbi:AP2/ERF domain-containing protein PFD0985w-like [Saccostrea cucullata]|uniref:AP2/ERF domain-containing protein PFD0985w-like n=1 Tax=Saccostrea cuccullata TaxID=36930 RepID=UPI002ED46A84